MFSQAKKYRQSKENLVALTHAQRHRVRANPDVCKVLWKPGEEDGCLQPGQHRLVEKGKEVWPGMCWGLMWGGDADKQ